MCWIPNESLCKNKTFMPKTTTESSHHISAHSKTQRYQANTLNPKLSRKVRQRTMACEIKSHSLPKLTLFTAESSPLICYPSKVLNAWKQIAKWLWWTFESQILSVTANTTPRLCSEINLKFDQ